MIKFNREMCDKARAYMAAPKPMEKQTLSKMAVYLRVSDSAVTKWMKIHPEFALAVEEGKKAYWVGLSEGQEERLARYRANADARRALT